METTYAFLKQNALASFLVVAVVSANGQIWLLNARIQGLEEEIQDLRAEMINGEQNPAISALESFVFVSTSDTLGGEVAADNPENHESRNRDQEMG